MKQKVYHHRWKEGIKIGVIAKFHGEIPTKYKYYDHESFLTAKVIEHPLPLEMGIDLACAFTIIYEIYKLRMAIISLCYNISL